MFKSIRWKFITVYFLLVLISMVIVAVFILDRLESQQIDAAERNVEQSLETIVQSAGALGKSDWYANRDEIQETLNSWRFAGTDVLYVIDGREHRPEIIAYSGSNHDAVIGTNAFAYKNLSASLIDKGFDGEKVSADISGEEDETPDLHMVMPVYDENQKIEGLLYMTSSLSPVYETSRKAKSIMSNATIIALTITVVLGYLISHSITGPIRDVTSKAREMAVGNFDQRVEVKSDDEIGQLGAMFNYLTRELKITLSAIESERSKLDTIFTQMAEGIIALSSNNEVIRINPTALAILGYDPETKAEGLSIDPSSIGLDGIDYEDPESLSGEKSVNLGSAYYNVKYAPYLNEKGESNGLIIVLQDVTKEHKLDEMRKEFVANVSHELKTPITTIKSYTETLMDNELDRETMGTFLSVIDSESDRMANLVKDLLQLSNLDHRDVEWEKENFDIEELTGNILAKLRFMIKEKRHDVVFRPSGNMKVYANKDAIEQVILNVVSNAIKYTYNGGTIIIYAESGADFVKLYVKDNGIGIPEKDLDRIFERFYRVEKGRSREMGGTGLGLSIAKEIVESHGGEIGVQSKHGEGSTIWIKLPAAR